MVLFFDLFAQEHCGGFGEHGLFIGTKLGIVGSHECHCACYIAVCEDRGDGEGVGGDTLDGSKRLGCGIGIVKVLRFPKAPPGQGRGGAVNTLFSARLTLPRRGPYRIPRQALPQALR